MNARLNSTHALSFLAAAALAALASTPALAAVDCSNAQTIGQVRACAAAEKGSTELRRFVQRTAPIYQLSYSDFAARTPAESTAAKQEAVKVAANVEVNVEK